MKTNMTATYILTDIFQKVKKLFLSIQTKLHALFIPCFGSKGCADVIYSATICPVASAQKRIGNRIRYPRKFALFRPSQPRYITLVNRIPGRNA